VLLAGYTLGDRLVDDGAMKKVLKIAVRDLVGQTLRAGDLSVGYFNALRAVDGIRGHQQVQKMRPAGYRAEVSVNHTVATQRFDLEIGGRVDGIFQVDGLTVIDEIKTTHRDLEEYRHTEDALHWGQLKCYAFIYMHAQRLGHIGAQLTYFQVESGDLLEIRREFTRPELEQFFSDLVARYLKWAEIMADWCGIRDDAAAGLTFPFPDFRRGQRQMAVAVYRTLRDGGQLMVQAATGIGKTMAVLFAAVKALGEGAVEKLFYLTARTTGRLAAEKAFHELRRTGLKFRTLTLTAREKICPVPKAACLPEECPFAKGHFDRFDNALWDVLQHEEMSRSRVETVAHRFRVCPFAFSLELSHWADAIICDYNYAFDPRVYLRRFFDEKSGCYALLIDEAHNLVDRAREMFSADLTQQPFRHLRRAVKTDLPGVYRIMGDINCLLTIYRNKCQEAGGRWAQPGAPGDLLPLLTRFCRTAEKWLARNIPTDYRDALIELYFQSIAFLRTADSSGESHVTCYRQQTRDLSLHLFCLNPAAQMKAALSRGHGVVLFSATLTPADYFQHLLGCQASVKRLNLPSPFPHENLGVYVAAHISTLYRHREQSKISVARTLAALILRKKGNYLLFFPSYKYLQTVLPVFTGLVSQVEILVQTPHMDEAQREAFLDRFGLNGEEYLVGFAVMGGIFGEGIDLVGDRLSGAVVVGVGLPGISFERELIRAYFDEHGGVGFEYAYMFPGINRVLQAAGRVIRSEFDRGIILLIDRRYLHRRYRVLLPEQWSPVPVNDEAMLVDRLDGFWKPS
jgi:DNA excision repair protein ERCC-2